MRAGGNIDEDIPLQDINHWNQHEARRNRAFRSGGKAFLESDLDCELGFTDKTVAHFLKQYDNSLKDFEKFVKSKKAAPPKDDARAKGR